MAYNTNSFTIAHYILLFLVVALCIGIIAWILISANNSRPTNNIEPVVRITNTDPCVKAARDSIAQMWAYTPGAVPEKYRLMAADYANEQITTRMRGTCNDTAFLCRPGQIRRDCDPCAMGTAIQMATEQHIADTIKENCGHAE